MSPNVSPATGTTVGEGAPVEPASHANYVSPVASHGRPDAAPESRYFNPELAWLEFDKRVLEEAADTSHPLLERVKFLSIFHSNLDEFFMIRVAGLLEQTRSGLNAHPPQFLSSSEQLAALRLNLEELLEEQNTLWQDTLLPQLEEQGIHLLDYSQLDDTQREAMRTFFEHEVFPVLTPLAVDPGHPFPHISNLSLNLAVIMHDSVRGELFARIKVPASLPRLAPTPAPKGSRPGDSYFVYLEQVISAHLESLFPGLDVRGCYYFRVTRDADMDILEDEAQDLLQTVEQSLRQRQFGFAVRLEVDQDVPDHVSTLLMNYLDLSPQDVYRTERPLGRADLMTLAGLDRPALKDAPLHPVVPPALHDVTDIFSAIRRGDILLHHPYQSFTPVVQLIEQAATDPGVLAIKQTLYRIGHNSPLVKALIQARENGKQVAVLVELKARFDEENNIEWARALEDAGVHVVYGLLGLKTHCKVALVVRREVDGIRRYVHLGTGNYNVGTARVYTDFGLLTCRPELGNDLSELFNYLTGFSRQRHYRELLVAPVSLRSELQRRIEREIEWARRGEPARLIFKMNTLQDFACADLLYLAATAGVQVDLLVRGICIARPNLPELQGRLVVTSVVGRFLEHSRVFYFRNGGDDELYLGSADLMPRNLDRRVETLFPIRDAAIKQSIKEGLLEPFIRDTVHARRLLGNGQYQRVQPQLGQAPFDVQRWLLDTTRQESEAVTPLRALPRSEAPAVLPAPD